MNVQLAIEKKLYILVSHLLGGNLIFKQIEIKNIMSWQDWKEFIRLNDGKIIDEYDKEITLDWLESWIKEKQNNPKNDSHLNHYPNDGFYDPEGYVFSYGDFS
jgi:hypothetical protein